LFDVPRKSIKSATNVISFGSSAATEPEQSIAKQISRVGELQTNGVGVGVGVGEGVGVGVGVGGGVQPVIGYSAMAFRYKSNLISGAVVSFTRILMSLGTPAVNALAGTSPRNVTTPDSASKLSKVRS